MSSAGSDVSYDSDSEEDVHQDGSLGATADPRSNSHKFALHHSSKQRTGGEERAMPRGFPKPASSKGVDMFSEPRSLSSMSRVFAHPTPRNTEPFDIERGYLYGAAATSAQDVKFVSPQMKGMNSMNKRASNNKGNFGKDEKPYSAHQTSMKGSISFDLEMLRAWSTKSMNPLVVYDIVKNIDGLCHWLSKTEVEFDSLAMFISLLNRMIHSTSVGSITILLKQIVSTRFFGKHLRDFFTQLPKHHEFENICAWIQRLLEIIQKTMTMVDQSKPVCKESLNILQSQVSNLNISNKDALLQNINELLHYSDINRELSQPTNKPKTSEPILNPDQRNLARRTFDSTVMDDEDIPPDHFTQLKVFPDTDELNSSLEPFLRANKTSGAYRDLEHYLDIHTRLLREDYTEPMRRGIRDYKEAISKGVKVIEGDFRFYRHVKIVKMGFSSPEGVTHFVSFDKTNFEHEDFDWETSKRLKYGSLLCFSKDDFENILFATVAEKEVKNLKKGILEVVFQTQLEEVFTISENDEFIMGETTAYFESYRHVLEGLKETTSVPLSQYIVFCQRDVMPPQYLNQETVLEIQNDNWFPTINSKTIPLNKWQLEAVKVGLSKELAVIQGPPGTGKTYVGLIMMRILLEQMMHSGKISDKPQRILQEKSSPILVVCYTNHALDQFLEGVLKFSKGIVRVGGRSSSELLEPYNLVRKRRQLKTKNRELRNAAKEELYYRRQLKIVSKHINWCWVDSLSLETTIVSADDLKSEMSEAHFQSLTDSRRSLGPAGHAMRQWLKASSANMENLLFKAAQQHLVKCIAKLSDPVPNGDCVITSERQASNLSFNARVKIYRGWLSQYQTSRRMQIQQFLEMGSGNASSEVYNLLAEIETANQTILEDSALQNYMTNDIVYESIQKAVHSKHRTEDRKNVVVRQWLLGSFSSADKLMDAIEQLQSESTKPSKRRSNLRCPLVEEDTEKWVIADSESDSDSDRDSDVEARVQAINLNDIDESFDDDELSDLKEIGRTFEENENKDILMKQRAEMLGIDITESNEMEEDEWQTANEMTYSKVFRIFHKTKPFSGEDVLKLDDLWSLPLPDRYRLYKYWVMNKKEKLRNTIVALVQEYKTVLEKKTRARSRKDVHILKAAKVIGMTTTGAAKNRKVLQDVGCKVILVEEAAEVLEAHIITTLSKHCQHLILIGDHQQLRPSPTVHQLCVQFKLDVSLFERLVNNGTPHVTLREQHRMRPEISLFMKYEYPNLIDHHSVFDYPDVRGVMSNVFFLQHCHPESAEEDTTSKANEHEAKFLTALSLYFVQQGYESYEITILAAYSAQVQLIRSKLDSMEKGLEDVFVTSIDNYQGQENEIILLSLVRSNENSQVGFLKINNRVVVALSRAKKGLFVIGDLKRLETKSKFWKDILKKAQIHRVTGVSLRLQCSNHNHITYVVNGEDFEKEAPEGGCYRDCNFNLPCSHICLRKCHGDDTDHLETLCKQPCLKKCPEGHPCELICSDPCRPCQVLVRKVIPLCGHTDDVACSMEEDEAVCSQTCNFKMQCGHLCRGSCGRCMLDGEHAPCLEDVMKVWPCTHQNVAKCHIDTTVDFCPEKCPGLLDCGHKCAGTCGGCLEGKVHHYCIKKCKKPLPCGHPCDGACGTACQPCTERCCNFCRHMSCSKDCGEPCDPCIENCPKSCYHRTCKGLCRDECQIPVCMKPCRNNLKCKHKCASLCAEECVCWKCEKKKFSLIDFNKTRRPKHVVAQDQRDRANKFEMTDDVILMKIPRCHHVFTLKQLDKYVNECDPKETSFIRCPKCPNPIHGINRYDQINRRRTERRENLKKELAKQAKVSEEKLDVLRHSKDIVGDFCMVDEGDFLEHKEEQIDLNHALALTMQMRFAYALKLIQALQREYNSDSIQSFGHCRGVIASIKDKMTPQLLSELTLELHRKLLLEEMMVLDKLVKEVSASIGPQLKADCKTNFRDFKRGKMTTDGKERFTACTTGVYGCLDSPKTPHLYKKEVDNIKSRAEQIRIILDAPKTEDLYEILQRQEFHKDDSPSE